MVKIPRFQRQKHYAELKSDDATPVTVGHYVSDFLDWYHDRLKDAPKLSGKTWMTAYSCQKHSYFRRTIHRGVGGYLRARDKFPDFRDANDFTEMTLLHSLVMPIQKKNPADKLNRPAYVPVKLRKEVGTAEVVRVFDNADDITLEGLEPATYFVKSAHGSKQMVPIDLRPGADPVDLENIKSQARQWLSKPYGQSSSQWWYQFIDRKVIIEADLREDPDTPIEDLRFHCVNGKMVALQLDLRTADGERNAPVYDSDLNYLPWGFHTKNVCEAPLPEGTQRAAELAEIFAQKHQYVRVDFYSQGGKLYLGELTYLPTSGRRRILSPKLNEYLCAAWDPMPTVVGVT